LHYQIVGRTHPNVARQQGFEYRRSLQDLVQQLGLGASVEFVDRYVEDDELLGMLAQAHLVVVPYDNSDQVSSGVITDAIGAGRPVVATRFPFASEMLDSGAGLAVAHGVESLAAGIRHFVESPQRYSQAAAAAAAAGRHLSWSSVADQFADLIRRQAIQRATA
jgi:glycosyltransferase involved in cell wall biosynthesis